MMTSKCCGRMWFFPHLRHCFHICLESRRRAQKEYQSVDLVHTFRFSTGRQLPIIVGQSGGRQERIGVFTQPGRLAGRPAAGQHPELSNTTPGRRPVADSAVLLVLLIDTFTHSGFCQGLFER